jgi:hypothetical protein
VIALSHIRLSDPPTHICCTSGYHPLGNFIQAFVIGWRNVMFSGKDFGLNDGQNTMEDIVGMSLSCDDLFSNLVASRNNMLLRDGYWCRLAYDLIVPSDRDFRELVYGEERGQLSGGYEGSSSISCGGICSAEKRGTKFEEPVEPFDAWETVDKGRQVLDCGRSTGKGKIGGVYVPGSVLVVTSVSTVLLGSTTRLRLGGSFGPSTIMNWLVCTLLAGWDCAKSVISFWLSRRLVLGKAE